MTLRGRPGSPADYSTDVEQRYWQSSVSPRGDICPQMQESFLSALLMSAALEGRRGRS